MRRYSSSTIFGARPPGAGAGDTKINVVSEKRKGRRHSSTQLSISNSETGAGNEKLKIVGNGLGDVDELQEGYGETEHGSETGIPENTYDDRLGHEVS